MEFGKLSQRDELLQVYDYHPQQQQQQQKKKLAGRESAMKQVIGFHPIAASPDPCAGKGTRAYISRGSTSPPSALRSLLLSSPPPPPQPSTCGDDKRSPAASAAVMLSQASPGISSPAQSGKPSPYPPAVLPDEHCPFPHRTPLKGAGLEPQKPTPLTDSGFSRRRRSLLFVLSSDDGDDDHDHLQAARLQQPLDFLARCHLCTRKLARDLDVFMYNGDQAFCSMECRYQQIVNDEQRKALTSLNQFAAASPHKLLGLPHPHPSSAKAGDFPRRLHDTLAAA